jgi:hypothetical protein
VFWCAIGDIMAIDESMFAKTRLLPPEKQQELADFVELLSEQNSAGSKRPGLKGLCAHAGVRISAEDIDQLRREIWGGFHRERV